MTPAAPPPEPEPATPERWQVEGGAWPLHEHSRFVEVEDQTWHVQALGEGPACLLLHGAGAAAHSWRDVAPALAERFRVVAPDLPGHGFSPLPVRGEPGRASTLPGLAAALSALLEAERIVPEVVVGHSAGAAILCRAMLDGGLDPALFVGVNPALWPLPGLAGRIFPRAARWMSRSGLGPRLVAWQAQDPRAVRRIVAGTGSTLDPRGEALYHALARSREHVEGTLAMLARWDLDGLADEVRGLSVPTLFVVGARDRAVDPTWAPRLSAHMPDARVIVVPDAGHLLNEEAPERFARYVLDEAARRGAAGGAHG